MSVKLTINYAIDRPVSYVFDFYARNHVLNHPRWDPDIELEQITEGPIGVGTIIHRRNRRYDTPVEGTMEVVEFEPDQAFGMVIHDGPLVTYGRTVFEAKDDSHTIITTQIEIPGMDENKTSFLVSRLERSGRNMKVLMEYDG
jgi:hypothetical protein